MPFSDQYAEERKRTLHLHVRVMHLNTRCNARIIPNAIPLEYMSSLRRNYSDPIPLVDDCRN